MNCNEEKTVVILADYAAEYKGNFLTSLFNLENKLKSENISIVYIFPEKAKKREWIPEMEDTGKIILFMSGKLWDDISVIRQVIKNFNPAICHVHFSGRISRQIFFRLFSFGKIKIIRHWHSTVTKLSTGWKKVLKIYLLRFKYGFVSFHCGCGKAVYEDMLLYFNRKKCGYITNCIDFLRLNSMPNGNGKKDYGFEKNIVCMMFASFFFVKGCDIAIEAIMQIHEKYKIKLILICSKKASSDVFENIVKICGNKPDWIAIVPTREDIRYYYNMSDIVLSPSRYEGFAYVLPEAVYCEALPIRSDLSALDHGHEKEFVVPVGDVNALRRAIIDVISLPREKKTEIIKKQRDLVVVNFPIEKWSNEIVTLYKNFIR